MGPGSVALRSVPGLLVIRPCWAIALPTAKLPGDRCQGRRADSNKSATRESIFAVVFFHCAPSYTFAIKSRIARLSALMQE